MTKIKTRIKLFLIEKIIKKTELVLVVSTGRTGTKFFKYFMKILYSSYPVFHEPKPDLFDLSIEKIRNNASEEFITKQILLYRRRLFLGFYTFRELLKILLFRRSVYVESNPFIFPIIREFSSNFKSTKVIFITRDFKTFCISAYNKDPQGDGVKNFYGKTDLRSRINGIDLKEYTVEDWEALKRIEKIAWYWNMSNKNLRDNLKDLDHILIKFENLFSNNNHIKKQEIKKILRFLNYNNSYVPKVEKLMENKINFSDSKQLNSIYDLDKNVLKKINEITKEMRKELNYKAIPLDKYF